ncbi:MAG: Tex family protein [Spirochaetaceae bacterium]
MSAPHASRIARELKISEHHVSGLISLLDEGATVPFIARYRKEQTGEMDEVTIRAAKQRLDSIRALDKRREAILASLEERELLTEELKERIDGAGTVTELEDLYLPYRPKRRTRATKAKELGLEPLAESLLHDDRIDIVREAEALVGSREELATTEEVLAGVRDIVAERIQEDPEMRRALRALFESSGTLSSRKAPRKKGKDPDPEGRFSDYTEWSELAKNAPSHRILALLRGEQEGALTVHLLPPEERALRLINKRYSRGSGERARQLTLASEDAYKRLLAPSLESERKRELKARADETAAAVFAENLRELLLAPPLGGRPLLAIDPGFRTGCKVVALDAQGRLLEQTAIYPLEPHRKEAEAIGVLLRLRERHAVDVVAVGNGTGGRETERFLKNAQGLSDLSVIMVNEAGASVYSASEVAREELPEQDVTVRGAVSIGRRLMDPLAELVKVDPRSIGVGQYQHDIPSDLLEERLEQTVVSCVNRVGVELNTASPHLLRFVAGLTSRSAREIVRWREAEGPFRSRQELLKVPGVGERSYEQSAGFLRIRGAENPLDASGVHPERYALVERMARESGVSVGDLMENEALADRIELERYCDEEVGMPTLRDISEELKRPGRDPRPLYEEFSFDESVEKVEELRPGMRLPGIVTNVTNFGAFVDVGVHRDGLVHISKLSTEFVSDPRTVVRVQQQVMVTVVDVDSKRNRISLSMIE